jgi:hypothetical protein
MNSIKEKFVPQRNITPNFIRFKRISSIMKVKIAVENLQLRNKIIEMMRNNHNVAHRRQADVALKSTKKEY